MQFPTKSTHYLKFNQSFLISPTFVSPPPPFNFSSVLLVAFWFSLLLLVIQSVLYSLPVLRVGTVNLRFRSMKTVVNFITCIYNIVMAIMRYLLFFFLSPILSIWAFENLIFSFFFLQTAFTSTLCQQHKTPAPSDFESRFQFLQ